MNRSLYDAPAHYRTLFDQRTDDVAFYLGVCMRLREALSRPLRVLELGAGTGRVALPTARTGATVCAVDLSRPMLDELERQRDDDGRALELRAVCADAGAFRDGERYDLVSLPFNGIAHFMTREALNALFETVRAHLADGALFVFDVWLPNPALLAGSSVESPWLRDRETGEPYRYTERYDYEPIAQVLTTVSTVRTMERSPRVMEIRQRQFFPEETLALLAQQGMELQWRTSRFELPATLMAGTDNVPREVERGWGEMLAHVCTLRK